MTDKERDKIIERDRKISIVVGALIVGFFLLLWFFAR